MAWRPFWQKNDNSDVDDSVNDNVNVNQNTAANATGTTDNAENNTADGNTTATGEKTVDLNEVTVTAPKPGKAKDGDGSEFTVSEEQLRDKGVDANGNFTVEPGMYDAVANENDNENTPANAGGTTADEVDGNIDWNNTEEVGETGVKPLDVKPITPAISGDPNETAEQKEVRRQVRKAEYSEQKAAEEAEAFAAEHPWVKDDITEVWDKYTDRTPTQLKHDIVKYRNMIGKPVTYEEILPLLVGRDPNKSKKEVKAEKRRAKWADVLNELGNVLAHFYNYGRTKAGSPAATINHTPSNNAERLRAADMAMRQRGYNDYVNAMMDAEKRRQQRADYQEKLRDELKREQMRHQNAIELKKMDWLSPETKKKLEGMDIDLKNKRVQYELGELKKAYQVLKNNEQRKKAEAAIIGKLPGNSKGTGRRTNNDDGKYTYNYTIDGHTYKETDEYKAYTRAMAANHPNERVKKKEKLTREDLVHAGVSFPGSGK